MRLLTLARDLKRRRARERQGLFVAEGIRAVEELLRSPLRVRGALVSPQLSSDARGSALASSFDQHAIPIQTLTEAEFASAAETDTPQGVLAIAEIPDAPLAALPARDVFRIVVLDAIQDPGNVGVIVRSAAALGALATVALPGTVDLWNAKVVRSSMGAHFHHPAFSCTWPELTAFLDERDTTLWGADGAGDPLDTVLADGPESIPDRLALAVGNEGRGLSPDTRRRADRMVALPIAPAVESLNVAVATGIILYELRR